MFTDDELNEVVQMRSEFDTVDLAGVMSGQGAATNLDTGVYSNADWIRLWDEDNAPWNSETPDP